MLGADDTLRFAGGESRLCGDTIGENLARDCVFVILAVLGNKNGNIPNREVKAHELDDTCCFGGWESRLCRDIIAENFSAGLRFVNPIASDTKREHSSLGKRSPVASFALLRGRVCWDSKFWAASPGLSK